MSASQPPPGLTDRELADWHGEQVSLRDGELARLKAVLAEREAELARLQREGAREQSARSRAEIAEAQIAALLRTVASLRDASAQSLSKAEVELHHAAERLAEANEALRRSQPPPPVELDEERVRSAMLVGRLAEVERECDVAGRERDEARRDRDAARGELLPLQAAGEAREARAKLAESAGHAADERAALAEKDAAAARADADRLALSEDEARAAALRAIKAEAELRALLDGAQRQLGAAKEEQGRLRDTVEALRRDLLGKTEELARSQNELSAAREREVALDAELRVARGQHAEVQEQLAEGLEAARREGRSARMEAQQALDQVNRADARAVELQAVIESLGRERAALRSEAGQMRARVEMLVGAEQRLKDALEELQGENDFLNQEVARIATATRPPQPPPLPSKRAE